MPSSLRDLPLEEAFLRKLDSLALCARKLRAGRGRGEHATSQPGSGVAFAAHRAYAPGDDLRMIDWKLFARSERLYLKQHEEERDLSVQLLIDCSGSMDGADGAKLAYAKQLAAALGYIGLVNLDRVGAQAYAAEPVARLAPLRGRARALVLLRFLAGLQAGGRTSLERAARAVCAREPRAGLALVLTDGHDPSDLLTGIDLLRYAKFAPVVLLIEDPRDASPTLHGELTLVDGESGAEQTLFVSERLLARYRAAYAARKRALAGALGERQVPTFTLSIDTPLERAVLTLLRQGGVVG